MTALQTLVVDDSASARAVLKRLLERKGAKVDMSESGSQALDYLRDHRPDVIFMDHTMPGMSGLDAIKAMREDPSTAGIPVIMYTSQSDEHYYQLALDNGASGIIPKPATWTKIANALEKIVPIPSPKESLALTIDQELTSLRDHLSFNMERQIELIHDELLKELDDLIKRQMSSRDSQPAPSLFNLIHTITDSKLHQMNLEMRQHMTAKMDVLLQDMKDEHRNFRQEIQQQLDQHLTQAPASSAYRGSLAQPDGWLQKLSQPMPDHWRHLPVWLAGGALLLMLISWPN